LRRLLRPIRPLASSIYRRRMLSRGIDRTDAIAAASALIIAPHPDDETIGCAIMIMRKIDAGADVHIVIASDGERSRRASHHGPTGLASLRRQEALTAIAILGVPAENVTFLGFPDGRLAQHEAELRSRLAEIADRFPTDQIIGPALADAHPDHRATARAVRMISQHHAPHVEAHEYPIRYWELAPWTRASGNPFVNAWYLFSDPIREWVRPRSILITVGEYAQRRGDALSVYAGEFEGPGPSLGDAGEAEYEVLFPVR
jgi:LmbE family N-acetylglucosaminyl deacetylase